MEIEAPSRSPKFNLQRLNRRSWQEAGERQKNGGKKMGSFFRSYFCLHIFALLGSVPQPLRYEVQSPISNVLIGAPGKKQERGKKMEAKRWGVLRSYFCLDRVVPELGREYKVP